MADRSRSLVLGIDPGAGRSAVAALDWQTAELVSVTPIRLERVTEAEAAQILKDVVGDSKWVVAMESQFGAFSAAGAFAVLTRVIRIAHGGIKTRPYIATPNCSQWRKVIDIPRRGPRKELKLNARRWVNQHYSVNPKSDDECEAICIAFAYLQSMRKNGANAPNDITATRTLAEDRRKAI